jgi:hypothetical protein
MALNLVVILLQGPAAFAQAEPPNPISKPESSPIAVAPPAETAPPPDASEPSVGDSLSGEAKDAYEAARTLLLHEDYAGALVKFERAYKLSYDFRLLWNMGSCEVNLKHYVRVLRLVEQYLREGGPRVAADQREAAEGMLRKIRPLVSEVRLVVSEAGASVFVDDELAGTTPLAEPLLLNLGDRRIRVSKPGFKDQVIVQHLVGASDATATVVLEPEVHQGRLTITSQESALINVDGNAVGVGQWDGPVAPGSHSIRVTASGMRPYANDVLIRDGEMRTVDITLLRDSSGVSVWWWVGGSVVAAAALGGGAYFLFRPSSSSVSSPTQGTISPGTLTIQIPR